MKVDKGILKRMDIEIADNGFILQKSVYVNDWNTQEDKMVLTSLEELMSQIMTLYTKHTQVRAELEAKEKAKEKGDE